MAAVVHVVTGVGSEHSGLQTRRLSLLSEPRSQPQITASQTVDLKPRRSLRKQTFLCVLTKYTQKESASVCSDARAALLHKAAANLVPFGVVSGGARVLFLFKA